MEATSWLVRHLEGGLGPARSCKIRGSSCLKVRYIGPRVAQLAKREAQELSQAELGADTHPGVRVKAGTAALVAHDAVEDDEDAWSFLHAKHQDARQNAVARRC